MRRIAVMMSLFAFAGVAAAGAKYSWPVVVDPAAREAYGSLASTRNSPDSVSYLVCNVSNNTISGRNEVSCYAKTAAGVEGMCTTDNPNLVAIGMALDGEGYLHFKWDKGSYCTYLNVSKGSTYEPK